MLSLFGLQICSFFLPLPPFSSLHVVSLLAHELGHNLNAPHSSISNDIMHGTKVCNKNCAFGQESREAINKMIDSVSCISQEFTDPTATFAPTPSPTCPKDNPYFQVHVGNLGLKDCAWFAQNAPWWYCQFEIVSTHCSSTCGTCSS